MIDTILLIILLLTQSYCIHKLYYLNHKITRIEGYIKAQETPNMKSIQPYL